MQSRFGIAGKTGGSAQPAHTENEAIGHEHGYQEVPHRRRKPGKNLPSAQHKPGQERACRHQLRDEVFEPLQRRERKEDSIEHSPQDFPPLRAQRSSMAREGRAKAVGGAVTSVTSKRLKLSSFAMIGGLSTWTTERCEPSTTCSARGRCPCLGYEVLPMCPGRTSVVMVPPPGLEPGTP